MNYQVYGDELYHHGILGQKWGVRRFQNPDGSLTPAGKKRVSNGHIKRDMNKNFNETYKQLKIQYEKTDKPSGADRAYNQAKKQNTKYLIEKYGKERMDKYYETEHKKFIASGSFFIASLAAMSLVAVRYK